jgi:hypothetical protein
MNEGVEGVVTECGGPGFGAKNLRYRGFENPDAIQCVKERYW